MEFSDRHPNLKFQIISSIYLLVNQHIYALDRFDPIRIRFIFNVLFFFVLHMDGYTYTYTANESIEIDALKVFGK